MVSKNRRTPRARYSPGSCMLTSPLSAPTALAIAFQRAAILLGGIVFVLSASTAHAQVAPPERNERHSETLELERRRPPLQLNIYKRSDADERIWNVEVAGGPGRTSALCRTTLPDEVGQEYYVFEVQTRKLTSTGHVVLLEARADYSRGPLDPPVYQIAMWVDRANSSIGW